MHAQLGRWAAVMVLIVGGGAAMGHARGRRAPARPHLAHTRAVLEALTASFVGQPTREELLEGGLRSLARLCTGALVHAERNGVVRWKARGRTQTFDGARMQTDHQVAAALEHAASTCRSKTPMVQIDDAVAAGVVMGAMDRHSAYLRPQFMERLGYSQGEMLGDPGVDPGLSGNHIIVKSVAPGSAAALAGVRPMTLLQKVDGVSVEGLSLGEVGALLLGPAGSNVALVLEPRAVNARPFKLELARDPPFALDPHIVLIGDVVHVVPGPLLGHSSTAVDRFLRTARRPITGVILDFRGNGGGRVGDAVALADLFIKDGPLAQVVSRAGRPMERFEATPGGPGEDLPLVVLVDGRSASAVELAALVLRERRKAPVMGSRTYGKGSVQKLIPIDGGGFLKITAAMYMTPAGTTVGEGLQPDVALDVDTYPRRGQEGRLETDAWLRSAYDWLTRKDGGARAPSP